LKGLALLVAIAILGAIYAVHAEDAKGPSELQQDTPLQEQPNSLPADRMREPGTTTTGHVEIDSNITRPRTQEDVVREILSSQPSDKPSHGIPRR
jgi:hypothetical protein